MNNNDYLKLGGAAALGGMMSDCVIELLTPPGKCPKCGAPCSCSKPTVLYANDFDPVKHEKFVRNVRLTVRLVCAALVILLIIGILVDIGVLSAD